MTIITRGSLKVCLSFLELFLAVPELSESVPRNGTYMLWQGKRKRPNDN